MDINGVDGKELEVYLHVPFCVRKCLYCDFLSAPANQESQRAYFSALRREIAAAAFMMRTRKITTLFIGGGTPSLSPSGEIQKTMEELKNYVSFAENAEITIEANPGTLTKEKLLEYRAAGINRLSIGCQSIHEEELKNLGRIHSFRDFVQSFELARTCGFTNINVDLMSGLPEQTMKKWEETLRTIAELSPEHISAYSLIIEEGTPFFARELSLPDEDLEREMYHRTEEILGQYGFNQYEISNYAKPGFHSRHNLGYWRRVPYLGFGIGAASLFEEERFSNETDFQKYLEESGNLEKIRKNREKLTREDQIEETMILGLRTREGVSKTKFEQKFGKKLESYYGKILQKYLVGGFLEESQDAIRLTEKGMDVSNPILAEFLL